LGLAGGMAVAVPLLALATYWPIGAPTLPGASATQRSEMAPAAVESSNELLEQLAAHVAANPSDAEGLALLARSYRQVRRYEDSARAYRQLAQVAPSGDTYANLGEVLAAVRGGSISRDAHDAFMKALEVDTAEPRARFYLGLEQAQLGNAETAIAIWRDLAADAPQDATWLDLVMQEMSRTAQQAGVMPMAVTPQHPLDMALARPAAAAAKPAKGLSAEDMGMIQSMVSGLAARLENESDDFDGWMMLGRSYTVLDNMDGALNAYEEAMALKPSDINSKIQFATLMIAKTDLDATGPLPASLTDVMADVLKIHPSQPSALFITGLARAKTGDAAGAREYWEQAHSGTPNGSPLQAELERRLESLN
jgi:cytochrome c-type biogenesis protein CcmH